jgi:hypothetical protein
MFSVGTCSCNSICLYILQSCHASSMHVTHDISEIRSGEVFRQVDSVQSGRLEVWTPVAIDFLFSMPIQSDRGGYRPHSSLFYYGYWGSFQGLKWPGCGVQNEQICTSAASPSEPLLACYGGDLPLSVYLCMICHCTRWFKYDLDWLCVNKSQFVPVIFEPPFTWRTLQQVELRTALVRLLWKRGQYGVWQVARSWF